MPGPPKGKPYKLTPEVTQKVMEALRGGNTRMAAAEYAGISYDSFARYFDADVTFGDSVKQAEAECEVRCVALVQKAAVTTWQAAAWWLERRRKEVYGRFLNVDLSNLGEDELRSLAAATSGASGSEGTQKARP